MTGTTPAVYSQYQHHPLSPTGMRYQFERLGYFCVDKDSTPEKPVVNRTVTLRDTSANLQTAMKSTG